MKALVICDDFYHSHDIIREGLAFLEPEWEFHFMTNMTQADLGTADLSCYNAILLCKDDQISPENQASWLTDSIMQKFSDFTENGGGFMAMHAGTVACKRSAELKKLVGCEFMSHPDQCPVECSVIHGINEQITNGVNAFTEKDEHYVIDITATDINVFLEGKSEHGIITAGYTRLQGNGRVVVLTPGHNLSVWQNEEYRKIIRNSLYWCTGLK